MRSRGQETKWFALSVVMVAIVFATVLGPSRASALRPVDIVLLFFGGFASGASFVRGIMFRRQGH